MRGNPDVYCIEMDVAFVRVPYCASLLRIYVECVRNRFSSFPMSLHSRRDDVTVRVNVLLVLFHPLHLTI